MSPPLPESRESFLKRLRAAAEAGESEVRFGGPGSDHVARREAGGWAVRRMEVDRDEAEAYLREHGIFMPEHAAMIAKPGAVVLEARPLEALIEAIEGRPWPFR